MATDIGRYQDIVNCVVITGDLFVSGPLIFRPVVLERILGNLKIENNTAIESIQFEFSRLVQIGQGLRIHNTFLGAIDDSFDSLLSVGDAFDISVNPDLLFITRSFGNLACVKGDFVFDDVPALNELGDGTFNSLRNVTGSFVLSNTGLQNTQAFFSLAIIGQDLTVTANRFFKNASHTEPAHSPLTYVRPIESSLDGFLNLISVGRNITLDGLVADYGECGKLNETITSPISKCYGSDVRSQAFSFCQAYDRDNRAIFGRTVPAVPVYAGPEKIRAQRSVRYQCTQSLMTQVQSTVYLGTFSDSIVLLGLQDLLASPNAGLTVFAPDDEAWVEAVGSFVQVRQLPNLESVILNNIVQGVFPYSELRSPLEIPSLDCSLSSDSLLGNLIVQLGSLEALFALSADVGVTNVTSQVRGSTHTQIHTHRSRIACRRNQINNFTSTSNLLTLHIFSRPYLLGTHRRFVGRQSQPGEVRATSISCAGICGDCTDECCCDALCGQVGDCCMDFDDICAADDGEPSGGNTPAPPPETGSYENSYGDGALSTNSITADLGPNLPSSGSCAVLRNARPLDQQPFLNCDRVAVASQPLNPVLTIFSQRCRAFPGVWKPCLFPNFLKTVRLVDSSGVEAKIVEPNGPTGLQLQTGNGVIHVTGTGPLRGVDGTAMAAPAGVLGLNLGSLPPRSSNQAVAGSDSSPPAPIPAPPAPPSPMPSMGAQPSIPFLPPGFDPNVICQGRCG